MRNNKNKQDELSGFVKDYVTKNAPDFNIKKLRDLENKLIKKEKETMAILEAIPDAIFQFDKNGRYLNYIPAKKFETLFPPEQFIGKLQEEITPPKLSKMLKYYIDKAMKTGEVQFFEYVLNVKQEERFYEARIVKIDNNDLLGIVRDITERKKSEESLKNVRIRLESFMDSATDAFTMWDSAMNLVDLNKTAEGYIPKGIKKEDLIGKNYKQIMPDFEETGHYEKFINVIKTGKPFFSKVRKLPVKYGCCYLIIKAFKVGDGLGVITTDITELKVAELERERVIKELEIKNEELEQFTYTVSHDLKSPLITINGFVGMIEDKLNGSKARGIKDAFKYIYNAVDKMDQLLKELLELSRIGRIKNSVEQVNINNLIDDVLKLLAGKIIDNRTVVKVQPELPTVIGDAIRLREIFQNLIDNGIKFTSMKEEPVIEIGYEVLNDEGVFFVKDNGIGIDLKYIEKIFGLFEQLDQRFTGTGIGLAIVKRIVELHGGRIWVTSKGENLGSIFYFTLPGIE